MSEERKNKEKKNISDVLSGNSKANNVRKRWQDLEPRNLNKKLHQVAVFPYAK
jgi:hypothetical protein